MEHFLLILTLFLQLLLNIIVYLSSSLSSFCASVFILLLRKLISSLPTLSSVVVVSGAEVEDDSNVGSNGSRGISLVSTGRESALVSGESIT